MSKILPEPLKINPKPRSNLRTSSKNWHQVWSIHHPPQTNNHRSHPASSVDPHPSTCHLAWAVYCHPVCYPVWTIHYHPELSPSEDTQLVRLGRISGISYTDKLEGQYKVMGWVINMNKSELLEDLGQDKNWGWGQSSNLPTMPLLPILMMVCMCLNQYYTIFFNFTFSCFLGGWGRGEDFCFIWDKVLLCSLG